MEGWLESAGFGVRVLSGRKRSAQVGLSAGLCHQGAPKTPEDSGPCWQPKLTLWAQRMEVTTGEWQLVHPGPSDQSMLNYPSWGDANPQLSDVCLVSWSIHSLSNNHSLGPSWEL